MDTGDLVYPHKNIRHFSAITNGDTVMIVSGRSLPTDNCHRHTSSNAKDDSTRVGILILTPDFDRRETVSGEELPERVTGSYSTNSAFCFSKHS